MTSTNQLLNTYITGETSVLKTRLLEILARKSYIEGKIILASGKESNFYIDCKQTTLDAMGGLITSVLFLRMLQDEISAVGGISVGADPLTSGVSQLSSFFDKKIDAFYVRKEPKKHGTSKWIEGPVKQGAKIAILEDVVTTGGSSLKAVDKAIEFGLNVKQIIAIVDRNEGGKEAFQKRNLDYSYLFDVNKIIERAKAL